MLPAKKLCSHARTKVGRCHVPRRKKVLFGSSQIILILNQFKRTFFIDKLFKRIVYCEKIRIVRKS